MSNFQKIILGIAIATMFVSYCLGANVLIQSVHGFFLVISVLIIAAAIKSGEGIFAHLATGYFLEKKYFTSAFFAGLCALLLAVSVSGTTMFLLIQHTKDTAKLEAAKEFLMTKEKDVEFARQELHACKSTHVTKCVLPKTEILNEKIAERDEAAKKFAKYTDAKGIDTAWHNFADFVGVSSGDDENSVNTEIFRNLALATLADVIAMILIAVVHLEFFKAEPKDEVKKTTSGRRDDDFFEPDFNDYKQSERTFNREPVKFSEYQPVNEQSVNDFIEDAYKQNLMKTIDLKTDVLVCSPVKGSGKSAIAALFARLCKQANHRVIVIDINFKRNAENTLGWYLDDNIEVVGAKGNYREITSFFNGIKKEIADRHNRDDMNYPQITIVIDEMVSLVDHIDSEILSSFLKTVLSNGRQLKLNLMICTHADTIEGTGLKGITALKDGMACELMPFFEFDNNGDKVYLVRKTSTFVTVSSKKPIKKSEIYYHPGVITANWRELDREPDFKQTIKNIVTPNVKNLKNLNGDIFPA